MHGKGVTIGILAAGMIVGGALMARAGAVEIRVGYGGWTLSPFHSTVETRCEEVIQGEFFELLNSILPESFLSPIRTNIEFSSSGTFLSAEFWIPLPRSRFAVGLRGDLIDFRAPFTASANETIDIFGFPIANLSGYGHGTVELNGLGLSLLGRWTAVASRRVDLSLRAGLSAFPFQGRVTMDLEASASTILGNLNYQGRLDRTIAEIREGNDEVPSLIIAPMVGLDCGVRITPRTGVFANLSISQGTFLSGGFFVSF
jgi:hypothetical protein